MHLKKNGELPVPAIAWKMTCVEQVEACNVLLALLERFGQDESSDIAVALTEASRLLLIKAKSSFQQYLLAKPGRPAKAVGIINRAIQDGTKSTPRKIGRPSIRPKSWDLTVYKVVEAERERLFSQNISKGTIGDAIESLLKTRIAPLKNRTERQTLTDYFNVTKSAYYRGKKVLPR